MKYKVRNWSCECKVADVLYDGEATASFIALHTALTIRTVRVALGNLINNREVEARIVQERSPHARPQTVYSLVKTRKAA